VEGVFGGNRCRTGVLEDEDEIQSSGDEFAFKNLAMLLDEVVRVGQWRQNDVVLTVMDNRLR
jgi:hypothetical protein